MDEIKLLLRNTHDFEAERKFLLSKLEDCNGRVNEQIKARLDYVNEQLSTIQIWMTLLSEDTLPDLSNERNAEEPAP